MDPLTVDDLLHLLGSKEAHILQLQRRIAQLDALLAPELNGDVVPVEPNGIALSGRQPGL